MGYYSPSPLKEISSRDLRKEGKQKKAMNDALVVEEGGYQDSSKEENFPVTHVTFPFVRARPSTLSNQMCLATLLVLHSII
jgi:hypothetical protein